MARRHLYIFDNGGETIDRYTVLIGDGVYTMSHNALSPQGVNQFCCTREELDCKSLQDTCTRVQFQDVPTAVQDAILDRAKGGE